MVRESNLRQPGSRRYTMQNHGAIYDDDNRIGSHVLKKSSNCAYWKPSWNKTKTIIRIFPGLDPTDPSKFDVFRLSTEPFAFGDWVRSYPAVRNFGETGLTFILYDPSSADVYDINSNPCWVMYRAIENACKNGQGEPEWYPLREFINGRGRKLSKPTRIGLVQCSIFHHNNKELADPDRDTPPKGGAPEDKTVIFELSSSAMKALFNLLEKRDEAWNGDPDDWAQYEYGDIVSLDTGAFVWFYEKGTQLTQARRVAPKTAFGGSRKSVNDDDQEAKGFDCQITREYNGMVSEILPEQAALIHSKVKPWDDVLQFYTNDEQAYLLNSAFPPSAVLFAFRDHPEWIDSTVKRMAVKTKQVSMRDVVSADDADGEEQVEVAEKPRAVSGWGRARPVTTKPAVVDNGDEEAAAPVPSPRPKVSKQDSVVPADEIDVDEEELDVDVNEDEVEETETVVDEEVDTPQEQTGEEDAGDFDEEPVKKAPAAALQSVKNARERSQARSRRK